jgi:hypothetical protein
MQTITNKTLADTLYYEDIPVLTYTIHYPYFTTTCGYTTAWRINNFYRFQAKQKENYARTTLYKEAVEQAKYQKENNYPFNNYEVLSIYQITYNNNCIVSLYSDYYTYLGGAHGTTERTSETWDFQTGKRLSLSDYFPDDPMFMESILAEISRQVTDRLEKEPSTYFEDYPSLIQGNFNIEGFYVTPEGIVIYYQQYDIAPYSTGIPEFLLPFQNCTKNSNT